MKSTLALSLLFVALSHAGVDPARAHSAEAIEDQLSGILGDARVKP